MVWRAGGFGGAGKGRTFFSVWFIAFLGPGGSPPWAALLGMARTVFTARVGPDSTSGWLRVGYLRGPWLASLSAVAVFGAGSCCAPRRSSLSAPRSLDARGGAPTFCPLGGPSSLPPAASAAGRRSSMEAFLWGTRRGLTHTTIPPVGFGRFLV